MKVFVWSFSGVYEKEEYRFPTDAEVLSFTGLTGTDCYCDPEAEAQLALAAEKLKSAGEPGRISFLDSGNYHYMSKILMETADKPFSLLVFDHHTDMQPPMLLPILSCGSWIRDALDRQPHLRRVIVIGPPQAAIEQLGEQRDGRISFVTEEEFGESGCAKKVLRFLKRDSGGEDPVYISIDKDVLDRDEVETNWDQGILSLDRMLEILEAVRMEYAVDAIDICGEPGKDAPGAAFEKSSRVNNRILETLDKSRGGKR